MRAGPRALSLRTRIAALTAGAVAVAVLAVSVATWVLVRRELRSQVDEGLIRRVAAGRARSSGSAVIDLPVPPAGNPYFDIGLDNAVQVVDSSGDVLLTSLSGQELPVTDQDQKVAAGNARPYLRDAVIDDIHIRVLTAQIAPNQAVQMVRALTEVDATLRGFAWVLIVLTGLGVAGASGAGLVVARRAIRPVERLTGAAEHVARTKELSARIEEDRDDELGRLARSFNEMLHALEQSREQQRRLVADASHELRTPLTSLRTNVEVLSRVTDMAPEQRERLLADLRSEVEELSALVGELVALATEQRDADFEEVTDVALDEIVSAAVDRTQRRTGRTIVLDSSVALVRGRPLALERAVSNLLDNATKWGPTDEPIDVSVGVDGTEPQVARVEVRDRGPGIGDEDRAHVFDRFYRATAARSMPGSGLGLAIVKDVVEAHAGRVWADEAPGGGAVLRFEIPLVGAADDVDGAEEASLDGGGPQAVAAPAGAEVSETSRDS
jgi:two-component system, OmpR family, sensor histidine kinase MprB